MSQKKVTVSDLVDQLHVTHQELNCLKDADYASDTHMNLLSAKEAISLWLLGAKKVSNAFICTYNQFNKFFFAM